MPARIIPVNGAEWRLKTVAGFAADQRPANAAAIAFAVGFGIDQKTGDGMHAENFEERLSGGIRAIKIATRTARHALCAGFVDRRKNGFLLFRGCGGERGGPREKFVQPFLNFRQTLSIFFLIVDREREQSAINEIHHAGFACAGSAIARNNAGGERFDFFGFRGSEKFPFLIFGK